MLQLGSKTFTESGVQVFADHADPDQFWYLPAPVQIARRDPGNQAQFTLIKFKPAAVNAGVRGGGFLMIETELTLDKTTERKILAKCAPLSNGSPRLSVVPFDDGDVQCIALNLQGPGGTTATVTPGSITFVEKILGASKPSLQGNNTAAFSLTLDQEGATLMEQAFKEGGGPVGVIYQLNYTALRPALDVEITADFKRVYNSLRIGVDFSAGFVAGGVPVYLKAGLDAAFEKLKQDGAIEIKVINFSNSKDAADKENWALDFFKNNLLADWFKATLPPVQFPSQSSGGINIPGIGTLPTNIPGLGGTPSGGTTPASGGGASSQPHTGGAAGAGTPASGSAGSGTPSSGATGSGTPAGGATGTGTPASGSAGGGTPSSGSSAGSVSPAAAGTSKTTAAAGTPAAGSSSHPEAGTAGTSEAALPAAVLTTTKREPSAASDEYGIALTTPSPGPQETLTFQGGGQPPVVRSNGTERQLNDQRQLKLDVPSGTTLNITAEYPGDPAADEIFFLYFDHENPAPTGFSVVPPGPVYQSYLNNAPNPPDARFTATDGSLGPDGSSTQGGAAALRNWLQTRLSAPKQVTVDSHASYENDDSKAALNLQLTQRRRQVALGIIGNLAQVTGGTFHGYQEARTAHRASDPNDRVTEIRGKGLTGGPVTLTATLSRPAAPSGTGPQPGGATPGDTKPPATKPADTKPADTKPADTKPADTKPADTKPAAASPPGMGVSLAFKLQIIEQEELKTVKLRYNRTEAVQQNYNPQGFIGLLTQDIGLGHFIEVDLDDPFFRTIDIIVDAPINFDRIGLVSAQMALDYGNPTDPVGVKHTDFTFDKTSPKERQHSFFMNPNRDTSFKVGVQYSFDPLSGWEGQKFSYDIPPKVTEDRTLLLNPFETFGFLEVKILAGDIDWSAVKSTEVHVRYEDPGVFTKQTVITLRPDSGEQSWKLRLTNPDRREVSYFFVHHLMDGSTLQTEEATTSATSIAVDDSFQDSLDIEFIPTYDTATIRSVFVDFHYEDPAHHYLRDERIEFSGDTPGRQRLHIALFDPNVKEYQLIYTILSKDNSVRRLPAVTSSARLAFVGETFN